MKNGAVHNLTWHLVAILFSGQELHRSGGKVVGKWTPPKNLGVEQPNSVNCTLPKAAHQSMVLYGEYTSMPGT